MVVWTANLIAAVCTICVLSALTMPAGVGGGILFVPVLRLVGQMSQSSASALSQVLITGASVGSIIFQIIWQLTHRNEPLLAQPYYVILMMPALLSGSLVGVFLNHLLPEIVSLIVLVSLCVLSSILIFRKGFETWRRENEIAASRKRLLEQPEPQGSPSPPPLPVDNFERGLSLISLEAGFNVMPEPGMYEEVENPGQSFMYENTAIVTPSLSMVSISSLRKRQRTRRASFVIEQEADVNPNDLFNGIDHTLEDRTIVRSSRLMKTLTKSVTVFAIFCVGYWVYVMLFTLLRGSRSNPSFSGIEPCGAGYWTLTGVQFGIGMAISLLVAWKESILIAQTFVTGIVATVSGASGGIILNPILLHRGLDPQQTSATTTIIMFVMASASALEFLLDGRVEPILASLMVVTFVGSAIGMTLVTWLVRRLGRQSFIVFLLGILVVIGGIMLVYLGIVDVIEKLDAGQNPFEFGQIC